MPVSCIIISGIPLSYLKNKQNALRTDFVRFIEPAKWKLHVRVMETNLFGMQVLSLFILLPGKLIIGKITLRKSKN